MLAPPQISIPLSSHRADPRDASTSLDRSWWLICCRAQHEKAVAARLLDADVPFVLPMQRTVAVKPSRHRVERDLPLFPTYLFGSGDEFDHENSRTAVLGRHVRVLPPVTPTDRLALVRDLAQIMTALESGIPFGPNARPIAPGSPVRVASGPLEGSEGVMVRDSAGGETLHLMLRAIGGMREVKIERWRCEVVEPQ